MKKLACILLALLLCLSALGAAGESEGPVSYLYTFTPGKLLEGEGTEIVTELLSALQIQFISENAGGEKAAQIRLLSDGEEAFTLTARETSGGDYLLACSLLGDNVLRCHREQMESFMLTLVQMLANLNVFKGENLDKVNSMATRFADLLDSTLNREAGKEAGINLTPYLEILSRKADSTEEGEPSEKDREELGAVKLTVYRLNEETRRELVSLGIGKLLKFPVIGSRLKAGVLKIGGQPVTEGQIREMFMDPPGETTVELATDAQDRPVRLTLYTPDISGQISNPALEGIRGAEIVIRRQDGENGAFVSNSTISLPGLEGELVSVRLDRGPWDPIPALPEKNVHDVGEMNSEELLKLVNSMKLVILKNAANMILSLPRCVFDMLGSKIFGK